MVHLRQSTGAGVTGAIDWIDQYRFADLCAGISESGMKFSFILLDAKVSFQGEIGPHDNTITGTWTTHEASGPPVFTRKAGMGPN